MKRMLLVRKTIVVCMSFLLLFAQSSVVFAEYNFEDVIDECWDEPIEDRDECYPDYNTPGSSLNTTTVMNQEKSAVDRFLTYYSATTLGNYRNTAWWTHFNSLQGPTNYYRTVCNIVATATFKGIVEGQPASYYDTYADKLVAVFDDYDNAPVIGGQPPLQGGVRYGWKYLLTNTHPHVTALGYPCALAASLIYPKIGSYSSAWETTYMGGNRTAAQRKAVIKNALKAAALQTYANYTVSHYTTQQAATAGSGDSKAEEAAWTGAFLALASQLDLGFTSPSSGDMNTRAQDLLHYAFTVGSSGTPYPIAPNSGTSGFQVINHNKRPNPLYGLSVIQSAARAALPYYKFGSPINERDNIPTKLYGLHHNNYRFVDVFESALLNISHGSGGNFQLINAFSKYSPNTPGYNYSSVTYNVTPYSYSGVADFGMRAYFQNGAFGFSYAVDKFNFNRYRDNNSPLARLISAQSGIINTTAYLPPNYNGSQWTYTALASSKSAREREVIDPFTNTGLGTIDERINTHFFINSMGAFEHMLTYMFLSSSQFLNKLT